MPNTVVHLSDLQALLNAFSERFTDHDGDSLNEDGTPGGAIDPADIDQAVQLMSDLSLKIATMCQQPVLAVRLMPRTR